MERALFRNMMYDLFNRLQSTRRRDIKDRQIAVLKLSLGVDKIDYRSQRAEAGECDKAARRRKGSEG